MTCPALANMDGKVKLILTTAVEHMPTERQKNHPNAGCIFVGDTPFDRLPEAPVFILD